MAHYLMEGSYTSASAKAMVSSPSDRSLQAKSMVESLGGTYHFFFFAFGDSDWISLFEFADDNGAAAASMALGATGAFSKLKTTKLFTAEEAQTAMKKAASAKYSPPGATA